MDKAFNTHSKIANMNLCICVSGQIRDNTEESFIALRQLKEELIAQGHDITIIFSIWTEISRKLEGVINIKQLKKIFAADLVHLIPPGWCGRQLWKKLKNTYHNITTNESKNATEWVQKYFPDAIIDSEDGNLMKLMFEQEVSDNNSIKMLYKIWRANEIKKNLEKQLDTKFDYVIRIRPDYSVKKINLSLEKNSIYIPSAKEKHSFLEDTFAMGSSKAIDYYCELFGKSLLSSIRWKGIHSMLSNHLNEASPIKYTVLPAQENGFEFRHMAQNSNKIDIDDIKADLNTEFYRKLFSALKLKRAATPPSIQKAISSLEELYPLCEDEDNYITFYILSSELYKLNSDYTSALKSLLMADFNYLPLTSNKFLWNHRYEFILLGVFELAKQLHIDNLSNLLLTLDNIETNSFIDQAFSLINKTKIKNNLNYLCESDKGKEILKRKRFTFTGNK